MVKVKLWMATAAIVGIAAIIASFSFMYASQLDKAQTNQINSYFQPKQIITFSSYSGIDKDAGTVEINNQTYFMTTLGKIDDFYGSDRNSTQFQGVTFTFPHQIPLPPVPSGPIITLDLQFPDGASEKFSTSTTPEHNIITTLSEHANPRAGITLYGDTMKLLVSTKATSSAG